MKILVTGALGFIGGALVEHFCEAGHEVFAVDREPKRADLHPEANFFQVELSDRSGVNELAMACENLDALFHFAGQSSAEASMIDPLEDFRSNYLSTVNLVNSFGSAPLYFFASSMAVYGDAQGVVAESDLPRPVSNYGLHKRMSERFLLGAASINRVAILRMFNVYGPGQNLNRLDQGMLSIYLGMALKNKSVEVKGPTDRIRDFVWVYDLVQILEDMLNRGVQGKVILNVSTGRVVTVDQAIRALSKALDVELISSQIKGTRGDVKGFSGSTHLREANFGIRDMVMLNEGLAWWVQALETESS